MTGDTTSDDAIRLGFTGLGARGQSLLELCLAMDDVAVPAICDVRESNLAAASRAVAAAGRPAAGEFERHERMLASVDLDGVIIATPWRFHVRWPFGRWRPERSPVSTSAPPTPSRCWDLVRTAEETGEHCMLLENGCYGDDRLAVLRMVREGLFGELVHCETGYCHDLRGRLNSLTGTSREETAYDVADDRYFRGVQYEKRNADLYRSTASDRWSSVSTSTPAIGS